jgi:hypothetical protein
MTHRPIAPIALNGCEPGGTPRALPIFEWVDPGTLLVDEGYQRDSSERSLKLVRKIISGWDWAKFKAPVGVLVDEGIELIDGQHTAIAACSHPDIPQIPVMIIEAAERTDRAGAFISHNRDRIAVTATQLHVAALAARQADALAVERACEAAGVTVLRTSPGAGRYPAASTVAVTAIGALIRGRGEEAAARVLTLLARAELAPITQVQIKATDLLLHDPEYKDLSADKLPAIIVAMGPKAEAEAKMFVAAHPSIALWKAVAIAWFKNRRVRAASVQAAGGVTANIRSDGVYLEELTDVEQRKISSANDISASHPSSRETGKRDARPKLSGWIPGPVLRVCPGCDERYVGDVKSKSCADCAYGCREAKSA